MPRAISLVIALIAAGASSTALAREPLYDHHEIDVGIDITILQQGNSASFFNAQYTYSFQGVDRNDEQPPILRRFVRHPDAVWARAEVTGATRESIRGGRLGFELNPLGGRLYLRGEAGVGQHITIDEEPYEFGWWFGILYGEVGFRPIESVAIGAFYQGQPSIGTVSGDALTATTQAQRSGNEQQLGATLTFVTPNQRLFATLTGYAHFADWTFDTFNPGPLTLRGFGATARLAYNLTLSTSLQLRGTFLSDQWTDNRFGDGDPSNIHYVRPDTDKRVLSGNGALDLIYFTSGRYGFRASAGGGYRQAAPEFSRLATVELTIGFGVLARF